MTPDLAPDFAPIVCTNFGECRLADEETALFHREACPFCGKSLASPYRVRVELPGTPHRTGQRITIPVSASKPAASESGVSSSATAAEIILFVDGGEIKRARR
jgi:hypothetical protein